jgi:hypothetical protein
MALKNDGTVWTWGANYFGQIGDGTISKRSIPIKLSGPSNIVAIAAGSQYSLAVQNNGTVWGWGDDSGKQLGDYLDSYLVYPHILNGIFNVKSVAAGSELSVFQKNDNTFWQMGNTGSGRAAYPTQITSLSNISCARVGSTNIIVLKNDGTVCIWGDNQFGQLADGEAFKTAPVKISEFNTVGPVAISRLTPNLASPQATNTPVTWTCTATGGTSLLYQFWVNTPGSGWSIPQDYSSNNTFVWTPATPGNYQVGVRVKDAASTNVYDMDMVINYTVSPSSSVSITSLLPNLSSPQTANTPVTWTCTAIGGTSLRYQFWVNTPGLGWSIPQDYSSSNTFVWTPSTPGNYQVGVRVKDAPSANVYDMDMVIDYTIQ